MFLTIQRAMISICKLAIFLKEISLIMSNNLFFEISNGIMAILVENINIKLSLFVKPMVPTDKALTRLAFELLKIDFRRIIDSKAENTNTGKSDEVPG